MALDCLEGVTPFLWVFSRFAVNFKLKAVNEFDSYNNIVPSQDVSTNLPKVGSEHFIPQHKNKIRGKKSASILNLRKTVIWDHVKPTIDH